MHLVAVKNAFHFANESKVLAQQQMNVTSSLYGNNEEADKDENANKKEEATDTNDKAETETANTVESENGETTGIKTAKTSNTLEGEVRNIDEDHKTDSPPPTTTSPPSTSTGGSSDSNDDDKYPTFPNSYHAAGIIILPESKIAEPFEIWYAPESKKSRIDYYYGRLLWLNLSFLNECNFLFTR